MSPPMSSIPTLVDTIALLAAENRAMRETLTEAQASSTRHLEAFRAAKQEIAKLRQELDEAQRRPTHPGNEHLTDGVPRNFTNFFRTGPLDWAG